jgi:hypothetical protein
MKPAPFHHVRSAVERSLGRCPMKVELSINGARRTVDVEPRKTLR